MKRTKEQWKQYLKDCRRRWTDACKTDKQKVGLQETLASIDRMAVRKGIDPKEIR